MYRNTLFLWCRSVKTCNGHNSLPHLQYIPASNPRFQLLQNYMRVSGIRTKVKIPEPSVDAIPPPSSLVKPALFTLLFSTASFTGAAIWQYENMRKRAREVFRSPKKWLADKVEPAELWFRNKIQAKNGSLRNASNKWYNNLSEGHKLFVPILFANVLVFAAWKIPRLSGFMFQYFVSNSASKNVCLPMLLSCFSHNSALHIGVNMYVLQSFMPSIVEVLGKEQFLALYLSSGVIAAFSSQVFRVLTKQLSMSLGASGCIMGILSYTCFRYPDTQLSIIFLPMVVFSASSAIRVLMLFDFLSLLMKFKFFDHAAHLGGALTGLFWYAWGNKHLWQQRGPLLEWWHQIRSRTN